MDDTIGKDALGWINLGGVDLKSFNIKSRSDASEFNNCKIKCIKIMFAVKSYVYFKLWFFWVNTLKKVNEKKTLTLYNIQN